jgi:uncharacterized protein YbjT (DUF2867 family)
MRLEQEIERVLVTGATGFVGFRVVAALLEIGIDVTVLVRPEQEDKLASLAQRVRVINGDIWNRGSLKGLARGQQTMIHLVGSTHADPSRGLTYQQVNQVSARNAIGMAISDGVGTFVLMSVAALPGMMPGNYILSKRESETYLKNSGLHWVIIRPPSLYIPSSNSAMLGMMSTLGIIPPLRWIIGRYMPLSVDVAARGVAAVVQDVYDLGGRIVYANELRRRARRNAPRGPLMIRPAIARKQNDTDALEDTPFGWSPSAPRRRIHDE